MIRVNGKVVEINKFPDGTPRITLDTNKIEEVKFNENSSCLCIDWFYENDKEMFYLLLVKKHLENYFMDVNYFLYMPYLPNARMDRVKADDEVFTLKYFCDFINSLNFTVVYVLDVHSNVGSALLNNCRCESPKEYIKRTITEINTPDLVLYFPDAGAAKRYSELFSEVPYCYGEKKRDWKSGKILGLDIRSNEINLSDKTVLMIDDIIAYGGSLHYSALELKNLGANEIYAYATHTENSILDKEKGALIKDLENNVVKKLFTTNSLFTGNHEKITVMEV